jgi:hypothetical protein
MSANEFRRLAAKIDQHMQRLPVEGHALTMEKASEAERNVTYA